MKKQILLISLLSIAPTHATIMPSGDTPENEIVLLPIQCIPSPEQQLELLKYDEQAKLKFHDGITMRASIENHAEEGLDEIVVMNDTTETANISLDKYLKIKSGSLRFSQKESLGSYELKPGMGKKFNVSIESKSPSFANKQDMRAKAYFGIEITSYIGKDVKFAPRVIVRNDSEDHKFYKLVVLPLSLLIAKERAERQSKNS